MAYLAADHNGIICKYQHKPKRMRGIDGWYNPVYPHGFTEITESAMLELTGGVVLTWGDDPFKI